MTATAQPAVAHDFRLDDRYTSEHGSIYLTGIQALVRMMLDRARIDRSAGHRTAGYVSGYEGSPLAGLDLELARRKKFLDELAIHHAPGLNEEFAATAVAGTQLAGTAAHRLPDGVVGYWYGKAPGLDRASDAFRHANMMGTDPTGGAVAFVGDDPAGKSSSVPSASEMALADLSIPTLVPADAADLLELGRHAVEMSRASGLWSALRIATVVADGASSANVTAGWKPPSLASLRSGLRPYSHRPTAHLLGPTLAQLERSFHEQRLPIALEYLRLSGVNKIIGRPVAHIGIVAAGPTYLVVRQALTALGLDDSRLAAHGIRLLKLGAVYPLEPTVVRDFATGLRRLLVVEDKRAFLEPAVKAVLYGMPDAPGVDGKRLADGRPLLSPLGELDTADVIDALARWLPELGVEGIPDVGLLRERTPLPLTVATPRTPFFCSGCPHNSSTQAVPGTLVGAGIGCHTMLLLSPDSDRSGDITGIAQMGGEGGHWIGMSPFVEQTHLVQNLGDGTFAHSGSLAIRAAVAAGANITFKLLRNSAVAMTGGQQPVGELGLQRLIDLLRAEGVSRVVVTSDDAKASRRELGRGTEVRHRDELVEVQRELAAVPGVTVLIHNQECAAELRRKRKRGTVETSPVRAFINARVCEGCGDCGAKSNCLSVEPVDTPYGRKTKINQSSCNLDFSCLDGDCPSFLTIKPGQRTRAELPTLDPPPEPVFLLSTNNFRMRITGIGGTGIVTVAQIIATAASTLGKSVRALDQTGLAQKGGAVISDVVISDEFSPRGPKLGPGECDLYLGCDILVATDAANLRVCDPSRTVAVVSSAEVPTGRMVIDTTATFPPLRHSGAVLSAAATEVQLVDAAGLSSQRLGDEQYANLVLLGVAYQRGALPLTAESIENAITLNGVATQANVTAFRLGRLLADDRRGGEQADSDLQDRVEPEDVTELIADRVDELRRYQNERYARDYFEFVDVVRNHEASTTGGTELTAIVSRNLFKLMAYKDEYEVARLSLDPALVEAVRDQFGTGATYQYRLHPPALRALGMKNKISLGRWFRPVFKLLVVLRVLRGTPFDVFGWAKVRRVERALVPEYRSVIGEVLDRLNAHNHDLAVEIAGLPDIVRGYEHVKMRNVDRYRTRLAELTDRYREIAPAAAVRSTG